MNPTSTTTIDDVKSVLAATLELPADRAQALDASSPLLGSLPELDSMAVLEVLSALEARFGVVIHDDEVTAQGWQPRVPTPGRPLPAPKPLFVKLDPAAV